MDYVAYAYAAIVALGGVIGFVKKGSVVSGLMGVAFGGIMGKLGKVETVPAYHVGHP